MASIGDRQTHAGGLRAVDTHLVVALHALLEERSVTRAARRGGVTQPTMSHALSRLRAHFGDPLLVRVGRDMTLSATANGLVIPVREAIERLERVFAPAAPFDPRTARRTFQLAATDNVELMILPRLVRAIEREAPLVDLRCRHVGARWEEELLRGDVDLKIGRAGSPAAGLRTMRLAEESFVCVVRRGHPAAKRPLTARRYTELNHLLVAPHPSADGVVDRALAARGLARRVALTVSHFLVAPFIVARTDLALTVSARVATALAPSLGLVTLPCPMPLPTYGLAQTWAARSDDDPAHSWLRDAVRRAAQG